MMDAADHGGANPLGRSGKGRALPFDRPARPRVRKLSAPFTPGQGAGPYRLPRDIAERLALALTGYRNREAAFALAVFLGRFWSSRARLARPFPVDRRALADRADLGLTEARVRGALHVLEEVGFLNRGEPPAGSVHRVVGGELHRKPITFGFGAEYGPSFAKANARATAARQRQGRAPRPETRPEARTPVLRQSGGFLSPKDKGSKGTAVIMGEVGKKAADWQQVALRAEPNAGLESALRRWREAGGFGG